jgi:hydroxymethylbilane synthase
MPLDRPVVIATRGSALALAQSNQVLGHLRMAFPQLEFRLEIIRTTGDRLQTANLANPDASLPKGLFTKELEVALLEGQADIAVHSLKDLPTELPEGLMIGAVGPRADVRDVLLYRDRERVDREKRPHAEWSPGKKIRSGFAPRLTLAKLPPEAVVATSSTRRAAVLKVLRPDLQIVPMRGNVGTRLRKLMEDDSFDATILAAAGLSRLNLDLGPRGELRVDPRLGPQARASVEAPPEGILATLLEPEEMLPAVGQGAVALEIRSGDPDIASLAVVLDHFNTRQAVTAERSFLRALGGGCQSPVAANARVLGHQIELRAATFTVPQGRLATLRAPVREAEKLGQDAAARLM